MLTYETQILVVGSGPAGLATAHTLRQAGYPVLILERGPFAAGVAKFPVYMKFFSTTELVELCGFPLTIPDEKPTRQQYLRYLQRFLAWSELEVKTGHEVTVLAGEDGAFIASGRTALGEPFEARAAKVVLATGAYDHPNRLNVPGEDLPKVSHYYTELNDYFGKKTLIVGGRHSASETALELARAGVDVTLCHRRPAFDQLKYWILPDLENRIKEGRIKAYLGYVVCEVRPHSVILRRAAAVSTAASSGDDGVRLEIENDAVLALIGYHPDPEFLGRMGVAIDPLTRQPRFDPVTYESMRRGVYLIGVILAGNISGAIFIENSRHHGQRVLAHLESLTSKEAPVQHLEENTFI